MIGKMYRPLKFNKSKKRGLYIQNKYKSNFGGCEQFGLNVNLVYDYSSKSEVIDVELIETELKLAVLSSKNKLINRKKVVDLDKRELKTTIYRKFLNVSKKKEVSEENPGYISAYNRVLKIVLGVSGTQDEISEVIELLVYPIILDNEEYLFLDTNSETLIQKLCQKGIRLVTEEEAKILHEKL